MTDPFGICLEPECHDTPEPTLPSTGEMAKSLLSSVKDIAAGAISGQALVVDDEVYNYRMAVCGGCEFFIKDTQRCGQCGCFMKTKAKFAAVSCPIHKWGTEHV